jgi:hypothetical protein
MDKVYGAMTDLKLTDLRYLAALAATGHSGISRAA